MFGFYNIKSMYRQGDLQMFISHRGEYIDASLHLGISVINTMVSTSEHWAKARGFVCPDAWCLSARWALGFLCLAVQWLVVCVRLSSVTFPTMPRDGSHVASMVPHRGPNCLGLYVCQLSCSRVRCLSCGTFVDSCL